MPPLSKKRKACIASTAKARKALRQDSEEELGLDHNYKGGLGGNFDVADSDVQLPSLPSRVGLRLVWPPHYADISYSVILVNLGMGNSLALPYKTVFSFTYLLTQFFLIFFLNQ